MRTRAAALAVTAVTAVFTLSLTHPAIASVGTKKAPVCAGKTKKQAVKQVKKAYDTALDGSLQLSLDDKFAAIEGADDPAFRAVLDSIAAKNAAMLATTSPQVNAVTCAGKKAADVQWDLVLSGQPATGLAPPGQAVLEGSKWKVAQTTVCDLFALADPTLIQDGPCAAIAAGG